MGKGGKERGRLSRTCLQRILLTSYQGGITFCTTREPYLHHSFCTFLWQLYCYCYNCLNILTLSAVGSKMSLLTRLKIFLRCSPSLLGTGCRGESPLIIKFCLKHAQNHPSTSLFFGGKMSCVFWSPSLVNHFRRNKVAIMLNHMNTYQLE